MTCRLAPLAVLAVALAAAAPALRADDGAQAPPPAPEAKKPHIPPTPAGVAWERDLATAKALAAEDGRPVLLYFTFETCHWCHQLEEQAFPDAKVAERAKSFHWVLADRDAFPEFSERFDVHAYPTLLVLGPKDENIRRFEGFRKADALVTEMDEAIRRHALCREGKPWQEEATRAATICDGAEVETFRAPSEDRPCGLCFVGDDLWIAQGERLRRVDAKGAVAAEHALPGLVVDIASDGKSLYLCEYGWTKGDPIHVMDPATGAVTRTIVTEANLENRHSGASGLAWLGGRLFVLEGMQGKVHVVDPETGKVERAFSMGANWLSGLDAEGESLVAAGRTQLAFATAADGKPGRRVPLNYGTRAVAAHAGRLYLMEQPVMTHDAEHRLVRQWPKETLVYSVKLPPESPAPQPQGPETPK